MTTKAISATFLLLASVACTTSITTGRTNSAHDVSECQRFCYKFYKLLATQDFDGASALCKGDMPPQTCRELLDTLANAHGPVVDLGTMKIATSVVTDISGKVTKRYDVKVEVKYERDLVPETLVVVGSSTDSLYLTNYRSDRAVLTRVL